jgi:hypothetical protein
MAKDGEPMNQSIIQRAIAGVMPAAVATGLFVSLATFQMPDGNFGPSGAPSNGYVNVAGLVNIPCMDAVPSTARVQATEVKDLEDIMSKGLRHMLLNGYYPEATPDGQIPSSWRAIVDGTTYDILGVEHDSQQQMTRMELELVTL